MNVEREKEVHKLSESVNLEYDVEAGFYTLTYTLGNTKVSEITLTQSEIDKLIEYNTIKK